VFDTLNKKQEKTFMYNLYTKEKAFGRVQKMGSTVVVSSLE